MKSLITLVEELGDVVAHMVDELREHKCDNANYYNARVINLLLKIQGKINKGE